jgi:hypothetical protein
MGHMEFVAGGIGQAHHVRGLLVATRGRRAPLPAVARRSAGHRPEEVALGVADLLVEPESREVRPTRVVLAPGVRT